MQSKASLQLTLHLWTPCEAGEATRKLSHMTELEAIILLLHTSTLVIAFSKIKLEPRQLNAYKHKDLETETPRYLHSTVMP